MRPVRIQRQRTKGWRMPPGAVYVGRPTIWGNPWTLLSVLDMLPGVSSRMRPAREEAVTQYREWVALMRPWDRDSWLGALRRCNPTALACWCRLDHPCHADVLIELLSA